MGYENKCKQCPKQDDCDFFTQQTDYNFIAGDFLPKKLRELCPGNTEDQHALFVLSWYLRGVYDYALTGKPYNVAFHTWDCIPEIDFTTEMPKVMDYLNKTGFNNFKLSLKDTIFLGINTIKILANPKFNMPELNQLNYVREKINER